MLLLEHEKIAHHMQRELGMTCRWTDTAHWKDTKPLRKNGESARLQSMQNRAWDELAST